MSRSLIKLLRKKRAETREYQELRLEERMVWDVAKKSKKVGYNPETGTNWCHLPMELRMMCINKIDFKSRIHLAATSKTEKSLVESEKFRIDYVSIYCDKDTFNVIVGYNGNVCIYPHKMEASNEEKLQCAKYLFHMCEVGIFQFSGYNSRQETIPTVAKLRKVVPFQCKTFMIDSDDNRVIRFILKNCTQLKAVTFEKQVLFDGLALFLPLVNVNEIHLLHSSYSFGIWNLVRKWIEIDAEVGKSVQFVSSSRRNVDGFISEFADRVFIQIHYFHREHCSYKDQVTIKTNNENKRILLLNYSFREQENDYISIRVIPSRGYSRGNCDEWIIESCKTERTIRRVFGII